ncbi:hypothetical protein [Bacillus cereus]|uniref:Cytoplasmic protein n=1 Tax=Bacillus cereus VD184 TaxID=1053242 RepID=A0A9W5R090_BACCE|nr:hypothetical protein [Bacillus cereus]EOQ01038.1 cytoplasmic protein [Bacillus cereus VD184]
MKGLKDLIQVAIQTNEREIVFTSFSGHILIKQSLDGETSSVCLTHEEFNMIQAMSDNENMSRFMSSVFNSKAM